MIARTWNGWTTAANADAYERLLQLDILPAIVARQVPGFHEVQLFRRDLPSGEVEFTTVMWFASLEGVRAFAGDDPEQAVVPERARALLVRFDARSRHAEVRARLRA